MQSEGLMKNGAIGRLRVCVCVWEVFLLRRVAGNLSIAL